MKEVLTSLLKARKIISETKMKKSGRNDYSKYDYFTPDQVSKLVQDACDQTGLVPLFSLNKNDQGYYGELVVYHAKTGESITTTMSTDMPEIKATNNAQKLGGAMTYTERYMKMSAFGIIDNNLDFDNGDNSKPQKKSTPKQPIAPQTPTTPNKSKEDLFVGIAKKEGAMSKKLAGVIQKATNEYGWPNEKVIKLLGEAGIGDVSEADLG